MDAIYDGLIKGQLNTPATRQKWIEQQKSFHPLTKTLLNKLPNSRYFGGQLSKDMLQHMVSLEKANKLSSPFVRGGTKAARGLTSMAGYLMSIAETAGRLTTIDAFMRTLEDPQAFKRAYDQVRNEPRIY